MPVSSGRLYSWPACEKAPPSQAPAAKRGHFPGWLHSMKFSKSIVVCIMPIRAHWSACLHASRQGRQSIAFSNCHVWQLYSVSSAMDHSKRDSVLECLGIQVRYRRRSAGGGIRGGGRNPSVKLQRADTRVLNHPGRIPFIHLRQIA
jgi:hypothetical protein